MSLRIWLPLNGDLHNQGLDIAVFNKTTNVWGVGKIGSLALLTSTGTGSVMVSSLKDKQEFSIAYWVKVDSSLTFSNWQDIWALDYTNSTGTYAIRDEHTNAAGNHQLLMAKETDTGGNTNGYITMTTANAPDTWQHIVLVKGLTQTKSYLNGVLKHTRNNTDFEITSGKLTGNVRIGAATCGAYLNDFRIYDHCLSAEEIRDIANGLVLHYKLDAYNLFNPNTITLDIYLLSSGNTSTSGAEGNWALTDYIPVKPNTTYIGYNLVNGGNGNPSICYYDINKTYTRGSAITANTPLNITTQNNEYYVRISIRTKDNDIYTMSFFEILQIIKDSSGYGHHGSTLNDYTCSIDSARYNSSINLNAGNSAINCGRGGMVTDSITVNFWVKSSAWANPISCTESGGWNFESSGDYFRFPVYISGVGYKYGVSTKKRTEICNNQWHMLTGVYDRIAGHVKIYVDGVLDNDYDAGTNNVIAYHSGNVIWLGGEATASATACNNGMIGLFSDLRIYCTALLDTEIKKLYNVSMGIDDMHNMHTGEFYECSVNPTLSKQSIVASKINEALYCPYDSEIYIEPDGSKWVHIFHQNNASSNLFVNTDTFTTSVYKSDDAWFYASLCNYIDSWEFLGVNKEETTSTEKRYRWILYTNPMTATFSDVAAANIARNTNGYTSSTWGGLYKKNSSTYLCMNNANSGNWWGAVGAWALASSGVPAFTGTVTKTGYVDLYVRVDNTRFNNAALHYDIKWLADLMIER